MADFRSARFWAREIIEGALFEGARAIDATMGNGNDTQWLCELVGSKGHVDAFDVQPEAIEHTSERLTRASLLSRAAIHLAGHERMSELVAQPVDAIVFNLGWLPGVEHAVTTQVDTTLSAAKQALDLLAPNGVMTICVYPGHEEGARERETLLAWAKALDPARYDALYKAYLNQPKNPPCLIAVQRRK